MTYSKCGKKNCQLRILYLAKLLFKYEGEIKVFPYKLKLREFTDTRPALQEMLKEILQAEMKKDANQRYENI